MKKVLRFQKNDYIRRVDSIDKTLVILKDASKQLQKLGLKNVTPKALVDGKIHQRAITFYKDKFKASPFYGEISFLKYMDLTETDIEHLKILEQKVKEQLGIRFMFYKEHNAFYSFFEHRREPEIHKMAGEKQELPITKLFKWVSENKIEVTLNKAYFELYATNEAQLQKLAAIEAFIAACKNMSVPYGLVKKAAGKWLKELDYNLNSYEVNYYELIKTVN